MGRGERLIKPGDSWFSPKSIEVEPSVWFVGVERLDGRGLAKPVPTPTKLRIPLNCKAEEAVAER